MTIRSPTGWNNEGWSRKAAVASGAAVLTYQGEQGVATSFSATNSPNTFVAMPLGTAFANRRVIAVITGAPIYAGAPTGITIGGVTATTQNFLGTGAGVNNFSGNTTFAWADVPTGTTGDVVVGTGFSSGDGYLCCLVYTFDKTLLLNGAPTYSSNNVGLGGGVSNPVNINTGAGGFIIGVLQVEPLGTPSGLNISSSTETYVTDGSTNRSTSSVLVSTKKSGSAANTPSNITWGWTGTFQSIAAAMAWN